MKDYVENAVDEGLLDVAVSKRSLVKVLSYTGAVLLLGISIGVVLSVLFIL